MNLVEQSQILRDINRNLANGGSRQANVDASVNIIGNKQGGDQPITVVSYVQALQGYTAGHMNKRMQA